MLDALRRHATGWVAKVLFGLLILSFAVWGIGDIFLGTSSTGAVAEVAGSEISQREVTREFENRLRDLQAQAGGAIDRRAAVSFGVLGQAVEAAIARRLLDAHGRDLGIMVADETVAEEIRQYPAFQGVGGFERERYDMFLRASGVSEAEFVASLRGDIARAQIVDAMVEPLAVPDTLARELYEFRNERRRGRALVVKADAIAVPEPSTETLQAFLEERAETYQAPEVRDVTLVVLKPEDLAEEIAVPEEEVRAAYDSRQAEFRTPERREVEQLLAGDEATIREAAQAVAAGKSFTEVAAGMGSRVERTELGPLAKGDLPADLDPVTFGLAEGAVSEPVQSAFGWHLIRVTGVEPEVVQPFEAVRDQLARELAVQKAHDQLPDFAARLDDEIAAGNELEAAAQTLGIEPTRLVQVDRTGHNPAKERLAADRLTPEILNAIFAAAQGETSLLEQTADGGYYMYHVDKVEPAHPRTLEEVRDQVLADWRAAEQAKAAKARAEELKAKAGTPEALAELAATESGVELKELGPVTRSDTGQLAGLSAEAVARLFATAPGQVAGEPAEVPAGTAIVATDEVIAAAPDEALLGAIRTGLLNTMEAELLASYETALRDRYPVSVDQAALANLMEAQAR